MYTNRMEAAPQPKKHWTNRAFLMSVGISCLLLLVSLVVNYFAGLYALERSSNSVTDLILSNTRVYDIDGLFIWGPVVFWAIVGVLLLLRPQRIPFTLRSIALFILIRAIFITLTHIGPFPDKMIVENTGLINKFTFGGDLFFSGHTGLPFLLALIFWEHKWLRVFFILSALFFGAVVLLGHLHYSIDVLAAFFITYSIFHIAEVFFKKDQEMFTNGI